MSNFKVELKKVVDDSYEIEIGYELEQISRLQVLLLGREIECASTIGILDDEMLIVEIIQGIKSAKIREPVPIELKTSLEIAVQIIDQHTAIGLFPTNISPFSSSR